MVSMKFARTNRYFPLPSHNRMFIYFRVKYLAFKLEVSKTARELYFILCDIVL